MKLRWKCVKKNWHKWTTVIADDIATEWDEGRHAAIIQALGYVWAVHVLGEEIIEKGSRFCMNFCLYLEWSGR